MAESSPNLKTPETTPPKVAWFRRLLGLPVTGVRQMRRQPMAAAFVACGVAVVLATGISAVHFGLFQSSATEPVATIDMALEQLDAGQYDQARATAVALHRMAGTSYPDQGPPLFVLGVAMAEEAASHWDEGEKQTLYLVAARYLEEARDREFPDGHHQQGLYMLATCLLRAGHYAESLPVLREAVKEATDHRFELYRDLASAYFHDAPPQLDQARHYSELALQSPDLSASDRQNMLLEQAEILLASNDIPATLAALDEAEVQNGATDRTTLLRANAMIVQTDKEVAGGVAPGDSKWPKVEASYRRAIRLLERAQSKDQSGKTTRKSRYLIGVCYHKLHDDRAAERAFARVRRTHYHTPEAIAAQLAEADIQNSQQRFDVALASYLEAIGEAGSPNTYQNPWVSLDEFRSRLNEAYRTFQTAGQFKQAIALSRALPQILPVDVGIKDEADARRAWAESEMREAETAGPQLGDVKRAEARIQFRLAGKAYQQLAQLRFATRMYPEDLWQSAHCLVLGHNYKMATKLLRHYLSTIAGSKRARALVALGESLLALGRFHAALDALNECIQFHPKHPETYRARLLASWVHEELNQFQDAEAMLIANLHHEDLTPRSLQWRASLFAYGKLLYREAMIHEASSRNKRVDNPDPATRKEALAELEKAFTLFQHAIVQLDEAVQRDPDAPQAIEASYLLAESWRQSAKFPKKSLPFEPTQARRNALAQQMRTYLRSATESHHQLQQHLSRKQEQGGLDNLDRKILRNTYFEYADALFDLGDYEQAIKAYSDATNRYQHSPEAIEALMQIASCYRLLQSPAEARATLLQAIGVLSRIPQDTDFQKTTRYNRDDWQELLTWLSKW